MRGADPWLYYQSFDRIPYENDDDSLRVYWKNIVGGEDIILDHFKKGWNPELKTYYEYDDPSDDTAYVFTVAYIADPPYTGSGFEIYWGAGSMRPEYTMQQCGEDVWCFAGVQTACPEGKNSPSGSSQALDCYGAECDAGYTGPDGSQCSACPEGTYKSAPGSGPCSDCRDESNSPVGSVSEDSCTCNAGYTGPDGSQCDECPAGTYKPATGPKSTI